MEYPRRERSKYCSWVRPRVRTRTAWILRRVPKSISALKFRALIGGFHEVFKSPSSTSGRLEMRSLARFWPRTCLRIMPPAREPISVPPKKPAMGWPMDKTGSSVPSCTRCQASSRATSAVVHPSSACNWALQYQGWWVRSVVVWTVEVSPAANSTVKVTAKPLPHPRPRLTTSAAMWLSPRTTGTAKTRGCTTLESLPTSSPLKYAAKLSAAAICSKPSPASGASKVVR